jgi:hypothetical protein
MSEATAQKLSELEHALMELAYQGLKTEMEVARLSKEMREFKNEMRAFKNEMRAFKNEMLAFKDEMKAFKDEMLAFKNEMREFKNEMRWEIKQLNRRIGEVSNKMGTLAEDMVAPNMPRVAKELFGCEKPDFWGVRIKKRKGAENREYDVIVVCADYVLINETKTKLKTGHVDEMIEMLKEFRTFFPEYENKKLVGILASLYVDESIIQYASKKGILIMCMGDETMEVVNGKDVKFF